MTIEEICFESIKIGKREINFKLKKDSPLLLEEILIKISEIAIKAVREATHK